jgi:hypothetical protein
MSVCFPKSLSKNRSPVQSEINEVPVDKSFFVQLIESFPPKSKMQFSWTTALVTLMKFEMSSSGCLRIENSGTKILELPFVFCLIDFWRGDTLMKYFEILQLIAIPSRSEVEDIPSGCRRRR